MTKTHGRINALFEELVPDTGKANTVAGELIRATVRIGYRNWNDGDHIGIGYGKETCNPAARYLMARGGSRISEAVRKAWGVYDDNQYDKAVAGIEEAVLNHIEQFPKIKEIENAESMWDFRDEDEDVDDSEEDEEEW